MYGVAVFFILPSSDSAESDPDANWSDESLILRIFAFMSLSQYWSAILGSANTRRRYENPITAMSPMSRENMSLEFSTLKGYI